MLIHLLRRFRPLGIVTAWVGVVTGIVLLAFFRDGAGLPVAGTCAVLLALSRRWTTHGPGRHRDRE